MVNSTVTGWDCLSWVIIWDGTTVFEQPIKLCFMCLELTEAKMLSAMQNKFHTQWDVANFQMCIQCRKLQKCLLMQAQTPKSPEQLCLLSFLGTSAHHGGRVCPAHTLPLPQHFSTRVTSSNYALHFLEKKKKVKQRDLHRSLQKIFLCASAQKSTHTCNQIQIHTSTHTHTNLSKVCFVDGCQTEKACSDRTKARWVVWVFMCIIFRQEKH